MIRAARYAYAVVAWATVGAIILQVFFIGLGLFVGSDKLELHRTFGWILHLVALIVPVSAALAAAGRMKILLAILLAAMVWVVPILAALRNEAPAPGSVPSSRRAPHVLARDSRCPRSNQARPRD